MTLEERNALVEAHLDLVRRMARAIARRLPACVLVDDLEQAGFVGLIEAVESYDPARGPLGRWARRKVGWAIRSALARPRELSIDADPVVAAGSPAGLSLDERLDLERGIARLPARQQHVVIEFDLRERTMRSIAVDLGIGESRVSQLRRGAIDKLRENLAA